MTNFSSDEFRGSPIFVTRHSGYSSFVNIRHSKTLIYVQDTLTGLECPYFLPCIYPNR